MSGTDLPAEVELALDAIGSYHLAYDVATSLSCIEAEALATILRYHGHDDEAETWINAHAEGDDDGDLEEHVTRRDALLAKEAGT